jgi:magnesium-transporting ATPase (P-type)
LEFLTIFSGVELESTELVPGDVVNLSDSQFSIVPADLFLLLGDAIVNESMLTGESVPVSKVPMKDDDLIQWREKKEENSKCFLYGGTRIVRIRGTYTQDGLGKPATALVARTGEPGYFVRNEVEFLKKELQASLRPRVLLSGLCSSPNPLGSNFIATPFVLLVFWRLSRALDFPLVLSNSFD